MQTQDILRPLCITRNYKGHDRTVYAIELVLADKLRLQAVTKEIYQETADHFGCN